MAVSQHPPFKQLLPQKAGHFDFHQHRQNVGSNVDPELRAIGFDGFICGCGTEIIYRNQVLFHQQVKPELCASIRELVRSCNATPLYGRSDTMFYDPTMPKTSSILRPDENL